MDYCSKSILDVMRTALASGAKGIPRDFVLQIMRDACRGVLQMHLLNPSHAHRDIKVENILADSRNNRYVLCDFGSATSVFDHWGKSSSADRRAAMDDIERNTTVDYHSPEQCDLYHEHRVDHRVDAWALGCVMYHLMYFHTPFEN